MRAEVETGYRESGLPPDRPIGSRGFRPSRSPSLILGGIPLFQPLDVIAWAFVLLFFAASSLLQGGDLALSLLGALGIIGVMFLVGAAVEVVIAALSDLRGLGTLVGFITNGPEMLCLIVGLIAGDVLFAASTPLGSNFMNPVMLVGAALATGCCLRTVRTHPRYTVVCILLTAGLAVTFFLLPERAYPVWLVLALVVTVVLFVRRPAESESATEEESALRRAWFLPALVVLVVAGYLLDPSVSFTAARSHAPKGLIGFFVLSTLTSWPEFKSCLALNRRRRCLGSVLNITVSNITNIWLALAGVTIHLLIR